MGFWCNCGCTDMIFCAHQLIEKTIEHNTKAFVLFIDLKKAYDSVPRAAMWLVLAKYGVPDAMISVIKSLITCMLEFHWMVIWLQLRFPMA